MYVADFYTYMSYAGINIPGSEYGTTTDSRQNANETAKDISKTYLHERWIIWIKIWVWFCSRQAHESTENENHINDIS